MHDGFLPPTLHCEDPHPAMADTRFAPVIAMREWDSDGAAAGRRQRLRLRRHQRPRRARADARARRRRLPPDVRNDSVRHVTEQGAAVRGGGRGGDRGPARGGRRGPAGPRRRGDAADRRAGPAGDRQPDAEAARARPQGRRAGQPWRGAGATTSGSPRRRCWPTAAGSRSSSPAWRRASSPASTTSPRTSASLPVRAAVGASLGRRGLELAGVGRLLHSALQRAGPAARRRRRAQHRRVERPDRRPGPRPFEEFADSDPRLRRRTRRSRSGLRRHRRRRIAGRGHHRGPARRRALPRQLPAPVDHLRHGGLRRDRPGTAAHARRERLRPGVPLRLPHPVPRALPRAVPRLHRGPDAAAAAGPAVVGDHGRAVPGGPRRGARAAAAQPRRAGAVRPADPAALRRRRARLRPGRHRQPAGLRRGRARLRRDPAPVDQRQRAQAHRTGTAAPGRGRAVDRRAPTRASPGSRAGPRTRRRRRHHRAAHHHGPASQCRLRLGAPLVRSPKRRT